MVWENHPNTKTNNIWFQKVTRIWILVFGWSIRKPNYSLTSGCGTFEPKNVTTFDMLSQDLVENVTGGQKNGHQLCQQGQSWEYCIEYWSKPEILKLFTVSKSIKYQTSNIEYHWYWKFVIFLSFYRRRSCILRPETHIIGSFRAPDSLPPY